MPDTFHINFELGLIEIVSFGIVSSQTISNSIKKAEEVFKLHGIKNLLVDTTEQDIMAGVLIIYRIFSTFPKQLNLALYVKKNQVTEEDIIFGETVAVNRGINMKVFYSKEDAAKWLNEL
jgi:hypothetical protein